MATELFVVKAGIATTMQDLGRPGYRAQGVPQSGALDSYTMKLANAVVGNPASTAVLEMLYSGSLLEVRGGSVRLALGGADGSIEDTRLGTQRALPQWQSAVLEDRERLRVGAI